MTEQEIDMETLESFAFKVSSEVDGVLSVRIDEESNKLGIVVDKFSQRTHSRVRRDARAALKPMASVLYADVGIWSTIGDTSRQPDFALEVRNLE